VAGVKVDLVEFKESVERELVELEERRSTLREQMLHIEAVQKIAGANTVRNSDG
jgi:hypothetical protein